MSSHTARDISLFAAGQGGEDPVNSLLRLAQGSPDTDLTTHSPEAYAGAGAASISVARNEESLYKTIIHVLVGPARKNFDVHKELLCKHSPYMNDALNGQAQKKERKQVYHVRYNLQKLLLTKQRAPRPVEMLAADGLLRKLEGLGDLKYIANFKATRLNKVLKAAIKSSHVPSNDSWMIKRRMHLLLTGYRRCLDAATAAATGQVAAAEITAEDSENTIDLPKTSPETFANFVHWMYKQKFESSQTSEDGTFPALTPLQFVHLYVLAAHLQNAKLQNLIADSLRPIAPPSTALREMITYVSAHPTRGSKLLSLVVRMYAQRALAQEMRDAAAEWMGKEFVVELAAVLLTDRAKGRTARTQLVGEPCEYHVHDKDNPPCAESG